MQTIVAILLGANIVFSLVLNERIKKLENKKDPYEKYRNADGLLRRKAEK